MGQRDDIVGILKEIPHRYPFILVDRVIECVPGERLTAIKNVTINEPFFTGHFPGQPVMPGVLILEALAQAGLLLGVRTAGPQEEGTLVYFAGIDKARFKRQVIPGDQLRLQVELVSTKRRLWKFRGEAWVDDTLACAADLMAIPARRTVTEPMPAIDPSARVDPAARLADDVEVGPFSVIGPDVEIQAGTRIGPHVVINGHTRLGRNNRVFQFVSLGEEPQHRGYQGEPTRLDIGDNNTFREFCSVHRGTMFDDGVTRIGNDNLLMAYVHIAHDCVLGDHITMANGASLAGHVRMGDHCILGGFALVYQFVHVGKLAFLGYGSGVNQDVPAFVMCSGYPAHPHGINSVGMRRNGYDDDDVAQVKAAYRKLYRARLRLGDAREAIAPMADDNEAVATLLASLNGSKRGIIR